MIQCMVQSAPVAASEEAGPGAMTRSLQPQLEHRDNLRFHT